MASVVDVDEKTKNNKSDGSQNLIYGWRCDPLVQSGRSRDLNDNINHVKFLIDRFRVFCYTVLELTLFFLNLPQTQ